jgi:glycosyltransferase involved in cell wall biosynthesis
VIRIERNAGPSRARNVGAENARGDILVFIDADVVFPEDVDLLSSIAEIFRARPGVDCVSTLSHPRPVVENAIAYNNSIYHAYYMDRILDGQDVREGRMMFFSSRLGAIRKEKFRASGGFHESLFTVMNEDGDLWTRLYAMGCATRLERRLYHFHRYPTDFRRFGKSYFYTALVQALIDRRADTSMDESVSPAEKIRRLLAALIFAWPLALVGLPVDAWLASWLAMWGILIGLMGRLNFLVWRHVPKRFIPGWYLVYVVITPIILAGYAAGLFLHWKGTPLLRGTPSRAVFFGNPS